MNADFVSDVNFYSGGFSAIYGDRLSSIMDISYREGNKAGFSPKIQLNMAGIGGAVEGPISDKGNYLFSFNRSYVDLILEQIEKGSPLPKYGDFQGKLVYNFDDQNKLTLLNVFSMDRIYMDEDKAIENDANMYGKTDGVTNTAGVNWQHIWSNTGYSNTSISHTYTKYDRDYSKTATMKKLYTNNGDENLFKIRNVNYLKLNSSNSIEFGGEATGITTNYNTFYGEYKDEYGNLIPPLTVNTKLDGVKLGLFAVDHLNFLVRRTPDGERFRLDAGARADYFTYNESFNFSPRASLTYELNSKTSFSLSAGLFYQNIPNNILVQSEDSAGNSGMQHG